ncbi:hypothetical protein [Rheinheimera maricola]|uniref:Uncharacterized protein n=1 Tax=Rheinheimera maricola TaxID=2793282 RepID=A0ABS7XAT9_9GAMM|nr:hypothetical protein [Rheinheimera maricola]MBZ9612683.1 hypothetical protein [Rheinheimera maricola]
MTELVNIDDVIKGYKDIPHRYYFKFMERFRYFHVGTAQEFLVTKESVKRWFDSFPPERRAAFRDAGYIQNLLDTPSTYVAENDRLVIDTQILHTSSNEPFEHAVMRIAKEHEFRDELIEERKVAIESLKVSTETESAAINSRIEFIDSYIEKVNAIYRPEKLARYYRGMLMCGNPFDIFKEIGGDIARF